MRRRTEEFFVMSLQTKSERKGESVCSRVWSCLWSDFASDIKSRVTYLFRVKKRVKRQPLVSVVGSTEDCERESDVLEEQTDHGMRAVSLQRPLLLLQRLWILEGRGLSVYLWEHWLIQLKDDVKARLDEFPCVTTDLLLRLFFLNNTEECKTSWNVRQTFSEKTNKRGILVNFLFSNKKLTFLQRKVSWGHRNSSSR